MEHGKVGSWVFILVAILLLLPSCVARTTHNRSTSVVQFLYPEQTDHIEAPAIPKLTLPLRVGVAFVPEQHDRHQALSEPSKMSLMEEVSRHFKQYEFVKSIDLIPSAYLRKEGGFTNLDQIQTMYGIDVIALLSYDQVQFTDEGFASITYWTLIGAYLVPGEKNDTHTMVDAAVYDIKSRKMLFRAPGVNHIDSSATPVNLSEKLREDSLESFQLASADLVINLDNQLQLFKDKVAESPEEYQVSHAPGYTGAGSLDLTFVLVLSLLLGYGLWTARRRRQE